MVCDAGELDRDGRANSNFAFDGETSAVEFYHLSGDREAEPGTLLLHAIAIELLVMAEAMESHRPLKSGAGVEKAHAIGKQVQRAIEGMDEVSRAFIHIDPLLV